MSPAARHALLQPLVTAGLAISVYLAALKFLALPCLGSGGCHAILHSRYGEIFRLPVGLYGALLWLAVIYVPDRTKRGLLLLLMAGASCVFLLIQFAVLRGFCLFCTLHAFISWAVLWLHGEKPVRWTAPAGLVLAAGASFLTRQNIQTHVTSSTPAAQISTASLQASASGLYWLGPYTDRSPALILSVDCPACLDLLEEITRNPHSGAASGPALFLKTTDANRSLTETFVAAVLSQDSPPPDAFMAVTTLLLAQKDAALSAPEAAAKFLAAQFPASSTRLIHARRILADHSTALHAAALGETTPLLIPREGKPRAFFKLEDLFR